MFDGAIIILLDKEDILVEIYIGLLKGLLKSAGLFVLLSSFVLWMSYEELYGNSRVGKIVKLLIWFLVILLYCYFILDL